jgi:hypothetical protein
MISKKLANLNKAPENIIIAAANPTEVYEIDLNVIDVALAC